MYIGDLQDLQVRLPTIRVSALCLMLILLLLRYAKAAPLHSPTNRPPQVDNSSPTGVGILVMEHLCFREVQRLLTRTLPIPIWLQEITRYKKPLR